MGLLEPIENFFDSLSPEAILIWQEFLNFPIIREFIYALVVVCLFAGVLKLLTTF